MEEIKRQEDLLLNVLGPFFIPELSREIADYLRTDNGWTAMNRINTVCLHSSRRSDVLVTWRESGTTQIRNTDLEVIQELSFGGFLYDCRLSDNGEYMICIYHVDGLRMSIMSIIEIIKIDNTDVLFSMGIGKKILLCDIEDENTGVTVVDYSGWCSVIGTLPVCLLREWRRYPTESWDHLPVRCFFSSDENKHLFVKRILSDIKDEEFDSHWIGLHWNSGDIILVYNHRAAEVVRLKKSYFYILF